LNILHYRAREEHQSRGEKEQKVYNNTICRFFVATGERRKEEKKTVVLPSFHPFSKFLVLFSKTNVSDLARIVVV
jgi:hypothetical protein